MKSKHLFIGILTVLFVFPLMGAFAQQEPAATTAPGRTGALRPAPAMSQDGLAEWRNELNRETRLEKWTQRVQKRVVEVNAIGNTSPH